MAFSFLCHTAVLPIYCELDRWVLQPPSCTFTMQFTINSPAMKTYHSLKVYLCFSDLLKVGCRMLPTSALASASCFTWSLQCLATSPSMVGLHTLLQLFTLDTCPRPVIFLFFVYSMLIFCFRSCGLWAAAWLRRLFASRHHGDNGSIGHPAVCVADRASNSLPCKYTDLWTLFELKGKASNLRSIPLSSLLIFHTLIIKVTTCIYHPLSTNQYGSVFPGSQLPDLLRI